jgi:hypothetical protein
MKKILLIAVTLFTAGNLIAQSIPNGGFEAWNLDKWYDPTGYQTSNDKNNGGGHSVMPPANTLKTTDAYHGKYAAKMTCIKSGIDTIAGYLIDGNPNGNPPNFTVQGGIPYNQMAKGIRVYYKYTVQKRDSALMLVFFKLKDSVIGSYFFKIGDTTSTYKLFTGTFTPALTLTPDTIAFGCATSYLVINNGRGMPGSILTVDSVTLTGVTSQPTALDGDFENWQTDSASSPVGWELSDPPYGLRTTDAKSGTYAIELTTQGKSQHNNQNNGGNADDGITIQISKQRDSTIGGYPYSKAGYDTLEFDYKYIPADTADRGNISVNLKKNSAMVGGSGGSIPASATYKHMKMPMYNFTTPDTALIFISSSRSVYDSVLKTWTIPDSYVGADLKIDNLQFTSQAVPVIPTAPTLTTSVINTTCGLNNGVAIVGVTGGTKPYSYTWTTSPVQTGDTAGGLPPGQYTVTVKDKNYTETAVVTISPSSGPGLTVNVSPSSCSSSNGGATANVTGGISPYTYSWSTGATTSGISGLFAGVYAVTITDNGGCKLTKNADVSDNGGPGVVVDSIIKSDCIGGKAGYIITHDTGGSGIYTFLWSNGATTQNISNLSGGTYNVTISDNGGCAGAATVNVPIVRPAGVSICMVTVDTNNLNNVIWAKSGERRIASFNIYREGSKAGVYNLVGSQPYDSLSVWIDPSAKPLTRSYRYKISEVDSCGNESPLSAEHKTMHLTVNVGLPAGTYNLIWDNYEGLTFYTYFIYRDTIPGIYTVIDSIPNNGSQTYSDFYPSSKNIYYRVGIDNPGGCNPKYHTKTYNSSHSNTSTVINVVTSVVPILKSTTLLVYPNPVKNVFYVDARGLDASIQMVTILDMTGRAIETKSFVGSKNTKESIDMSSYAQGMYLIKVSTSNGIFYQKVSKVN